MKTIAIIGAGLGGLSASIKLASKGYDVHVFEKNAYTGGKMMPVKMGTHHFDFGPNTMTMPSRMDTNSLGLSLEDSSVKPTISTKMMLTPE